MAGERNHGLRGTLPGAHFLLSHRLVQLVVVLIVISVCLSLVLGFLIMDFEPPSQGSLRLSKRHDGFSTVGTDRTQRKAKGAFNATQPGRDRLESQKIRMGTLDCKRYGGPDQEIAQQMVYWKEIPADWNFVSPYFRHNEQQYLTFEADGGGLNNFRMSFETVVALAAATGRTLVLPPVQPIYHFRDTTNHQSKYFSLSDIFEFGSISQRYPHLKIVNSTFFLKHVVASGDVRNYTDPSRMLYPPNHRTDWDGLNREKLAPLVVWMRKAFPGVPWDPDRCIAVFLKENTPQSLHQVQSAFQNLKKRGFSKLDSLVGHPKAVDTSLQNRLDEQSAQRYTLCHYDSSMQNSSVLHLSTANQGVGRLLVHFYAFLFFQEWRHDLWMKRFIRDNLRFKDEIQCAAARIVNALRNRSRHNLRLSSLSGDFDAVHVRRADFKLYFNPAYVRNASEVSRAIRDFVAKGSTIYVATDEKNKTFFQQLVNEYDVAFLDDYVHLLGDLNTNFYGMVEQLVASQGRFFFGCWFSTFTGYINRIRGYHANNRKLAGHETGAISSWYIKPRDRFNQMQIYYPVKKSFYSREFPTSWRLIDTGL